MKTIVSSLVSDMMAWESGYPERINHFLKVLAFAGSLAREEKLSARERECVEICAVLHDIGIKPAMGKYGVVSDAYQEQEGIPAAAAMLEKYNANDKLVNRALYIIGHHHTLEAVDGMDFQVIIEADFLVNCIENSSEKVAIDAVGKKYFKTSAGKRYLTQLTANVR